MTYAEAVQFLYDLQMFGAKFGLENTFKLAALAGNPQEKLRFIHVAGTNGKGSTCAMLESIYRAAGLRVGLFTSPHLVSFAERIQVDRQLVSEGDVARLVCELREKVLKVERVSPLRAASEILSHGAHGVTRPTADVSFQPTFFEFVTVMALKYFAEQKCELVIWETGMGGRLDATNIVTPLASVITNVEFDHEKWLGSTLSQIAFEKAGIIKHGVPIITAANEPEALNVIAKTAREKNSRLTQIGFAETKTPPLDKIAVPLLGVHQRLNAALAIATARILGSTIPISENAIRDGLSRLQWPGRLQQIKTKSGQTILLDGAHNPSGAMALRAAIAKYFPGNKPTLIIGILQDKEWSSICEILMPLAEKIFVVPVSSERTTAPEELERAVRKTIPDAKIVALNSLAQAFETTAQDSLVVVTGSLYLVGEALELLQENAALNERGLNEWIPKV
ncbi:MAG: folylpolyglutamate synthase/dihydrofolate synthase family protein [Verrucomicrobiota bacterium]